MTAKEISAFCIGIALLVGSAVSLDEGLYTMADDADDPKDKELLTEMARSMENGASLSETLKKSGIFPEYVISMTAVGEETGTLEMIMKSLADYYEKEHSLTKAIKNALTYPIIMIFMLVVVCFVLLVKVMPIFENIYEQMGTQLPQAAKTAIEVGGVVTGVVIAIILAMAVAAIIIGLLMKRGVEVQWTKGILDKIKSRNKIALAIAKRRFTAVMSLAIRSGMDMKKGLDMAEALVENENAVERIRACRENYTGEIGFYEAMKRSGLFTGMDLQLLKVGDRSGRLNIAMDQISERYEEEVNTSIENMIGRFEPTMVAALAIVVGMILFAVMMPLVGILSSIG